MARPVGRPGETRERAIQVALELFAEHGVSGTSLQMIANRLNVTKAAIYHIFSTKDELIRAVIQPVLDLMIAFAEEAEAQPTRAGQVDVILRGIVEVVIQHGRTTAVLQGDPAVAAAMDVDALTQPLEDRVRALLTGPNPDAATLVAMSIVGAGLYALGSSPILSELDHDTLRREMLTTARRLMGPLVQ